MDSINSKISMNNISLPSAKILTPNAEEKNSISDGFTKQEPLEKTTDLSKSKVLKSTSKSSKTWETVKAVASVAATLVPVFTVSALLGAGAGAGMALVVGASAAKGAAIFGTLAAMTLPFPILINQAYQESK